MENTSVIWGLQTLAELQARLKKLDKTSTSVGLHMNFTETKVLHNEHIRCRRGRSSRRYNTRKSKLLHFGNELADATAKQALQLQDIAELPVASHDMHPSIRRGVMEKWQRHWSSTQEIVSNKLREVKPEIGFWKSGCSLSRYTETRIARLLIH